MNVHDLEVANGVNPRVFAPIPIQIGLDVEVQGVRHTVAMTQEWTGFAVVIDGKTLLRGLQSGGRQIPVDLHIEWEADKLHFDHTGAFANLSALLIADQAGVTSIDVSILNREALEQGEIVAEESASTGSFRIFSIDLSLSASGGDIIEMDVGTNVVPRRRAIAGERDALRSEPRFRRRTQPARDIGTRLHARARHAATDRAAKKDRCR